MRISVYAGILAITCTLAAAAAKHEPVTYVDGDLTGVLLNSGASLVFSGDDAMELKSGLAAVSVPYKGISKAELGSIHSKPADAPLYKVWTLHKHILKSETQVLKVEFTNADGEHKSMTLELAKSAAHGVLDTIQQHASKPRRLSTVDVVNRAVTDMKDG